MAHGNRHIGGSTEKEIYQEFIHQIFDVTLTMRYGVMGESGFCCICYFEGWWVPVSRPSLPSPAKLIVYHLAILTPFHLLYCVRTSKGRALGRAVDAMTGSLQSCTICYIVVESFLGRGHEIRSDVEVVRGGTSGREHRVENCNEYHGAGGSRHAGEDNVVYLSASPPSLAWQVVRSRLRQVLIVAIK